ncbi:MAG: hypothetical protein CFK52_06530 [Chloracidobacterium sp. CP2_5A]|nr:MAG: hypothetical protein CFK52_06530 [Chloracidobacterium sp. CP2_5A]
MFWPSSSASGRARAKRGALSSKWKLTFGIERVESVSVSVAQERTTRQALPSRREQTREAVAIRGAGTLTGRLWDQLWAWRPAWAWAIFLVALSGLGLALTRSSLFTLRQVEVIGCEPRLAEDVERAARQNATGSLLTLSLTALRQSLESLSRVRQVSVIRILPDTLRIVVAERKPAALAQMAERGGLVWLDEEGVVIAAYDPEADGEPPNIAVGFASDRTPAGRRENRERLQLYRNLMWALDAAEPRLSERIESVDLSHLQDVRAQLRGSRVVIGLGKEDFRARLLHACEIVDALQRRDAAILERLRFSDPRIFEKAAYLKSVNIINPKQVNLEFDDRPTGGAARSPSGGSRPEAQAVTGQKPKAGPRAAGSAPRR